MGLINRRNKEINKVVLLPISEIHKNPNQPRKYFDPQAIRELAASIEENGLLQPITVRKISGNYYELIAGERRTHAFKFLAFDFIPAIIEDFTAEQSAVLSLIENLQRKDLNYFEEAEGIQKLMDELGLSQQQISSRLGKAQSTIANKLRLLKFIPHIRRLILERNLTERHARALLKLDHDDALPTTIDYIWENRLNVEQTEEYIEELTTPPKESNSPKRIILIKDMRIFINTINKAVMILNAAGIPAVSDKKENEEYIEMTIHIPKKEAIRQK